MKSIFSALSSVLVFFICIMLGVFSTQATAQAESLDKVVAIVNSTTITQSELNRQIVVTRMQMKASGAPIPAASVLRKKVLDQLINNQLQFDVAKKTGLTITDNDVNNAIAKIAAQNNIPVATLVKSVNSQGISTKAYHDQIKQELTLNAVQAKFVMPQVKVSPQDIVDAQAAMKSPTFLKSTLAPAASNPHLQYHVIDLLVALPDNSTSDQINALKTKAQSISSTLQKDPGTFQFFAKDPGVQVIDLGWRNASQLPSVLSSTVLALKIGQFSQPVLAPNGFHVLQLAATNAPAGNNMLNNAPKISAKQLAFQYKFNEALANWIQKLRGQSYIKIMEEDNNNYSNTYNNSSSDSNNNNSSNSSSNSNNSSSGNSNANYSNHLSNNYSSNAGSDNSN